MNAALLGEQPAKAPVDPYRQVKTMDKKMDAAVFPGQGSQRPGMGRDFYDAVAESRQAFEEASDRLGYEIGRASCGVRV